MPAPRRSRRPIAATATVGAPPEAVFAALADLERHWLLADRFVEVLTLDGPVGARDGGTVALRGPLGLRRVARTRVLETDPPRALTGTAGVGDHTRAAVRWTLTPTGEDATTVELAATVEAATRGDALLLALGGRRWLARRFAATLRRLAAQVERSATPGPRSAAPV